MAPDAGTLPGTTRFPPALGATVGGLGLSVPLAGAVTVARPVAGFAGAGASRHREHAEQRGQRDGHGGGKRHGQV